MPPAEQADACMDRRDLRHFAQNKTSPGRETMSVGARRFVALTAFVAVALTASAAAAEKKYERGASDTEIKIGNIMPYSGPASSYGVIGKTEAAFFNMINAEGGINGRKINFI